MGGDRKLFGSRSFRDDDRRDRRGGDRQIERGPREALPTPSANAYRRKLADQEVDRDTDLKRKVKSLLNKISPDNLSTIAARIKSEANVENVAELKIVIGQIFSKALAEPHYCETYADLVFHLKTEMPEFPNPEDPNGKPVTFRSSLLTVCQDEFEAMPRTLVLAPEEEENCDKEELEFKRANQKKRFLANMKFIGHLFLRSLLTTKIIASIVQELMCCNNDNVPEEHIVECMCEFLCAIGYTLEEQTTLGKQAMTQVCGRMLDLKQGKKKDGKSLYSKRIQFAIQDVL